MCNITGLVTIDNCPDLYMLTKQLRKIGIVTTLTNLLQLFLSDIKGASGSIYLNKVS